MGTLFPSPHQPWGSSYLEKRVGAGAMEAVGSGVERSDKGTTF